MEGGAVGHIIEKGSPKDHPAKFVLSRNVPAKSSSSVITFCSDRLPLKMAAVTKFCFQLSIAALV
jgi:hypothetical protein